MAVSGIMLEMRSLVRGRLRLDWVSLGHLDRAELHFASPAWKLPPFPACERGRPSPAVAGFSPRLEARQATERTASGDGAELEWNQHVVLCSEAGGNKAR